LRVELVVHGECPGFVAAVYVRMHDNRRYVKSEETNACAPPLGLPLSPAHREQLVDEPTEPRCVSLAGSRETSGDIKKFCHQLSRSSSGGRTFAEPISLSSTDRIDFRLPATALTIGFGLLASRTRRRQDTKGRPDKIQGPARG
jgi:hypothetical protein